MALIDVYQPDWQSLSGLSTLTDVTPVPQGGPVTSSCKSCPKPAVTTVSWPASSPAHSATVCRAHYKSVVQALCASSTVFSLKAAA